MPFSPWKGITDIMDNKTAVIIGGDGQLCGLIGAEMTKRGVKTVLLTGPDQTPLPYGDSRTYTSQEDLLTQCKSIAREKGAPDYLVINVITDPAAQYGALHETGEADWRKAKQNSVDMIYGVASVLIAPMIKRGGRVLFIGALGGALSTTGQSIASAMSAATATLMQSVAAESNGAITANALLLGPMEGCWGGMDVDEKLLAHISKHRKGRAEEAVSVAVYTLLDAPDYFSGNVLRLDGGLSTSYMREW